MHSLGINGEGECKSMLWFWFGLTSCVSVCLWWRSWSRQPFIVVAMVSALRLHSSSAETWLLHWAMLLRSVISDVDWQVCKAIFRSISFFSVIHQLDGDDKVELRLHCVASLTKVIASFIFRFILLKRTVHSQTLAYTITNQHSDSNALYTSLLAPMYIYAHCLFRLLFISII